MSQGLINIADLPVGGTLQPTDLLPTLRTDGTVVKTSTQSNMPVLFAAEFFQAGCALCIKVDGKIYNACADNITTAGIIGFSAQDTYPGDEVKFQLDWAIITTAQILYSGGMYWLSDVDKGYVMDTPPIAVSHYVVSVGISIDYDSLIPIISFPQLIV